MIEKNKQFSLRSVALSLKRNQVKIFVLRARTSKFEAVQKSSNVLPEFTDRPARRSSLNDSIKSSETLLGLAAWKTKKLKKKMKESKEFAG